MLNEKKTKRYLRSHHTLRILIIEYRVIEQKKFRSVFRMPVLLFESNYSTSVHVESRSKLHNLFFSRHIIAELFLLRDFSPSL